MSGRIERSDIISDEAVSEINRLSEILTGIHHYRYRIVEYDSKFTIQRKRIKITESGILWWKKTDRKTVWDKVDLYGNNVYRRHCGQWSMLFGDAIDSFDSLKEAKDKIKVFQKGETIHNI